MSRHLTNLVAVIAIAAFLGAAISTPSVADGLTLKVHIDGFKSEIGQVFICLWETEKNFPKCEQGYSAKRIAVKITNGVAVTAFDGLVPPPR